MIRTSLNTRLRDFPQSHIEILLGNVIATNYTTARVGTLRDLLLTLMTAYVKIQMGAQIVIEGNLLELSRLYTEDLLAVAGLPKRRHVFVGIIYSDANPELINGDLMFPSGVVGVVQGETELDARREAEAYLEQKLSMASDGVVAVPPGPYGIKVIHDLI